jgi:hypothetical protein
LAKKGRREKEESCKGERGEKWTVSGVQRFVAGRKGYGE